MNIVAQENETLDTIIEKSHSETNKSISKALEMFDLEISSKLDKSRWEIIKIDERTILSSYGLLSFKRRYYYDRAEHQYLYPLDNVLKIPKNSRITNELRIKILAEAAVKSYREVGETVAKDNVLSKSTIFRIIKDSKIEQIFPKRFVPTNSKIHVQIDEKFIGMTTSTSKKRYYTATIFAGRAQYGKNKHKLLNKSVLSSNDTAKLAQKLNVLLKDQYKVNIDDSIFLSGDLATYIQNFPERITVCKAEYVPDKFHVYRAIKLFLPDLVFDEYDLNTKQLQNYIINELNKFPKEEEAKKIVKLLTNKPESLKGYINPDYEGCSQEGQNSHIYAPRFGKYGNRFNPSTIEKLSLIREAKANDSNIVISSKKRKLPSPVLLDYKWHLNRKEKQYINLDNIIVPWRNVLFGIIHGTWYNGN